MDEIKKYNRPADSINWHNLNKVITNLLILNSNQIHHVNLWWLIVSVWNWYNVNIRSVSTYIWSCGIKKEIINTKNKFKCIYTIYWTQHENKEAQLTLWQCQSPTCSINNTLWSILTTSTVNLRTLDILQNMDNSTKKICSIYIKYTVLKTNINNYVYMIMSHYAP